MIGQHCVMVKTDTLQSESNQNVYYFDCKGKRIGVQSANKVKVLVTSTDPPSSFSEEKNCLNHKQISSTWISIFLYSMISSNFKVINYQFRVINPNIMYA